jgi:anthranilate/para-aminobenzoate synthase component II
MALESKKRKIYAVQFHPESIMTDLGKEILRNFLLLLEENT